MKEAQTISEVLHILQKQGYIQDFKAESSGLKACEAALIFAPEDLDVDQIFRFEGETDLNEEAIIFALSCSKSGLKGTYMVAFGPMMDALDEQMTRRLQRL